MQSGIQSCRQSRAERGYGDDPRPAHSPAQERKRVGALASSPIRLPPSVKDSQSRDQTHLRR